MKRMVFPILSKIILVLSGVLFGIYLLIKFGEILNIYIFFSGVGAKEIMPFITIPCVALLISAIVVFLYQNCKHKTLKITVVALSVVFSICLIYFMIFAYAFSPVNTYFEYTSDDQHHTIVVNEMSFLLGGWGDIYEKTSFCTMKKVGQYSTDDGYCPFTNDAFFFVWNEEDFELHYYYGNSSGYKVVKMEYAK